MVSKPSEILDWGSMTNGVPEGSQFDVLMSDDVNTGDGKTFYYRKSPEHFLVGSGTLVTIQSNAYIFSHLFLRQCWKKKNSEVFINMKIQIPENCHPHDIALIDGLKTVIGDLPKKLDRELSDITFIVSDARGWICEAGATFRTIRINIKVLEVIYAYCFAYEEYYEKVCRGLTPGGQYISMVDRRELLSMRNVLTWATDNLTGKQDSYVSWQYSRDKSEICLYLGYI